MEEKRNWEEETLVRGEEEVREIKMHARYVAKYKRGPNTISKARLRLNVRR